MGRSYCPNCENDLSSLNDGIRQGCRCPRCGQKVRFRTTRRKSRDDDPPEKEKAKRTNESKALPIAQLLGLHPTIAIVVVAVDWMLTALDATIVLWPVSCLAAVALIWPCYNMQKSSYGDTHDAAISKALFVAILTAIPTPLPSFLTGGAGLIGWLGLKTGSGKKSSEE